MKDDLQNSTANLSARRRLVRGAFAAPAALSLYSGSALAATSSNACLAKEVGAKYKPAAGAPSDAYVRVQLHRALRNNGKYMDLVSGNDIAPLRAPNTLPPFLGADQWLCFFNNINVVGNRPFPIIAGGVANATSIPPGSYTVGFGPYVALKIDIAGNITGVVGIGNASGSAVHASCWTSFRGTAP